MPDLRRLLPLSIFTLLLLAACGIDGMADQRKIDPLEGVGAFPYQQPIVAQPQNTLPRAAAAELTWRETGQQDGAPLQTMPLTVTAELLATGQEQYNVFCSPCHGLSGSGDGTVVQRGFPEPPSFHSERLREAPDGHLFDVITNGFGQMYAYGPKIEPSERWAIIAYVRALQLSQYAPLEQLQPADEEALDAQGAE